MIKLLKAAGTQKRFRKFQSKSTASRKSCGGVLYMTVQKNYCSVRRLATQVQLVDKNTDKYDVVAE